MAPSPGYELDLKVEAQLVYSWVPEFKPLVQCKPTPLIFEMIKNREERSKRLAKYKAVLRREGQSHSRSPDWSTAR